MYFDPNDPHLRRKIAALRPTPGYCIFIDIVGSTSMKTRSLHRWAALIQNTFANVAAFLPFGSTPLKCLGDALMFFIPTTQVTARGESALTLFAGIASVLQERDRYYRRVKAAVVLGSAYELSFIRGLADFYGKDIDDLCARLLSRSRPRRASS